MSVVIDGIEYHKVLNSVYMADGTQYAQFEPSEHVKPFNRIVDGDNDVWRLLPNGRWDCHNAGDGEGCGGWYDASRDELISSHGFKREYHA